jgi:hypothetical protein
VGSRGNYSPSDTVDKKIKKKCCKCKVKMKSGYEGDVKNSRPGIGIDVGHINSRE